MTRKTYRTARGRTVDLGALQLKNENVRAVGNMGVNARGDVIDSQNRPIDSRNKQVATRYRRQTTNVEDRPVATSQKQQSERQAQIASAPEIKEDPDHDFDFSVPDTEPQPPSGLAAAIARARQIKQEPLRTQKQVAQHQSSSSQKK